MRLSIEKRRWWRGERRDGCTRIRVHTNPGIFENAFFFSFLQIGRFLHKLVNPPKKNLLFRIVFSFFFKPANLTIETVYFRMQYLYQPTRIRVDET